MTLVDLQRNIREHCPNVDVSTTVGRQQLFEFVRQLLAPLTPDIAEALRADADEAVQAAEPGWQASAELRASLQTRQVAARWLFELSGLVGAALDGGQRQLKAAVADLVTGDDRRVLRSPPRPMGEQSHQLWPYRTAAQERLYVLLVYEAQRRRLGAARNAAAALNNTTLTKKSWDAITKSARLTMRSRGEDPDATTSRLRQEASVVGAPEHPDARFIRDLLIVLGK